MFIAKFDFMPSGESLIAKFLGENCLIANILGEDSLIGEKLKRESVLSRKFRIRNRKIKF